MDNTDQPIQVPVWEFSETLFDLLPVSPLSDAPQSREQALAKVEGLTPSGLTVCVFYRGLDGLYWPSILNEQTLPRLMPTYRRALEGERMAVAATEQTFRDLLWWYVGMRLPLRTREGGTTPPKSTLPGVVAKTSPVTFLEGAAATGRRTILVDTTTGQVYVGSATQVLHAQVYEAAGIGRYVGVIGAMGRFEGGVLKSFELATGTFAGTESELAAARQILRSLGAAP